VTRNGKDAVVIVSAAEWQARRQKTLVEVLLDPSIRGILQPGEEHIFDRDRDPGRPPPDFR